MIVWISRLQGIVKPLKIKTMFDSTALEVVIGLVFIYLLYSLLGTLLQEIIATRIKLRQWLLQVAIRRMLDDEKKKIPAGMKKAALPQKVSEVFYSHPLVKYLAADDWLLSSHPAYISKETFSKVVIDLLRGKHAMPGDDFKQQIQASLTAKILQWDSSVRIENNTGTYLNSVWADSQGDLQKFKVYLEQWFDQMMERTTGWYKKYTQVILFFTGLLIAGFFNVDTIKIAHKLQHNPKLRAQVIAQANDFTKAHPNLEKELQQTAESIKSLDTPGSTQSKLIDSAKASYQDSKKLRDSLNKQAAELIKNDIGKVNDVLSIGWDGGFCKNFDATTIIGWILTALAISLGAPFWFDTLNKLMQLRAAITNKNDKTDKSNKGEDVVQNIKRVG
jgi:hypothetical protein